MANAPQPTSFAAVLRQYRLAARLTQEVLAERAGMSARGIQNLEGGVSRPNRDSAHRLAAALNLTGEDLAAFLVAAQPSSRRVRSEADGPGGQTRHNLPVQVTSFVGRERELAALQALLVRSRLLTLVGTGGCGKTRLALQLAAGVLDRYPDGVWLAELASLADEALAPAFVASALGVREQPGQPLVVTIVAALRPKRLLLLLDNCEHLPDACARLADALLRGCPAVQILATSRAALGMAGETTWRVPSLTLPKDDRGATPDNLIRAEAVRLFCERAGAVRPEFALTAQNAVAVAQLCRRLDGLPLAIELAAAWTRSLGVRRLAEHLDEGFRLLTGGNRTAPPRQQTLRAAIDWSYGLLDDAERRLFARLSVFAGGWTLAAAEAVGTGDGIAREAVLDLLARLAEQSLVQVEEQPDGGERYRLLETLRQYGREKLVAGGEAGGVHGRHAECYLALAEDAEPHVNGPQQEIWLGRLEAELDNVRAALRWWLEQGNAECGLRMMLALRPFWGRHGFAAEALRWLAALLSLPARVPSALRGQALVSAAIFYSFQGDLDRAGNLGREARETLRTAGDRRGEADSLVWLACFALLQGDYVACVRLGEESLALWHQLGIAGGVANALLWLGRGLTHIGNVVQARPLIAEALATSRQAGNPYAVAMATEFLGEAEEAGGEHAAARNRYSEALTLYQELGDQGGIATVSADLGRQALRGDDRHEARRRYRQGLTVAREMGFRTRLCDALEGMAALAAEESQPERALRLAGAATALRGTGVASPMQRDCVAPRLEQAQQAVGEQQATAAWAAGQALSLEEAVAEALRPGPPV